MESAEAEDEDLEEDQEEEEVQDEEPEEEEIVEVMLLVRLPMFRSFIILSSKRRFLIKFNYKPCIKLVLICAICLYLVWGTNV